MKNGIATIRGAFDKGLRKVKKTETTDYESQSYSFLLKDICDTVSILETLTEKEALTSPSLNFTKLESISNFFRIVLCEWVIRDMHIQIYKHYKKFRNYFKNLWDSDSIKKMSSIKKPRAATTVSKPHIGKIFVNSDNK